MQGVHHVGVPGNSLGQEDSMINRRSVQVGLQQGREIGQFSDQKEKSRGQRFFAASADPIPREGLWIEGRWGGRGGRGKGGTTLDMASQGLG
jgi:hypothetical protein